MANPKLKQIEINNTTYDIASERIDTLVIGNNATAGTRCLASGVGAKAENQYTAIAFGSNCEATGNNSQAFGNKNKSTASGSFTLGNECLSSGSQSFAGGNAAKATQRRTFAFGDYLEANQPNQFVIGKYNDAGASINDIFVIGYGDNSNLRNIFTVSKNGDVKANQFIVGNRTALMLTKEGDIELAEGNAIKIGQNNVLTEDNIIQSVSDSQTAIVSSSGIKKYVDNHYPLLGVASDCTPGELATSKGHHNYPNGYCSHTAGGYCVAGAYSHASGNATYANTFAALSTGYYGKRLSGDANNFNSKNTAFVIGGGSYDKENGSSNRQNIYSINFEGTTFSLAQNIAGADYAEYFEWLDLNSENEDRIALFVSIADGEKIKIAEPGEEILGVVSATAGVIGDSYESYWKNQYLTDVYGRFQYHYIEGEAGPDGEPTMQYVRQLNPDYNPDEEYIPRSQRKEWDVIGLLGKLIVRDDGTCEVNGRCTCGAGGIATYALEGYRVLKRLDDSHILILMK